MTFDPTRHIIQLRQRGGGLADYLPVAARLAWFRDTHPEGCIAIEAHVISEQVAIFRASVRVPAGGSAEGWGSESPQDFKDYIEKASTKALGRALAAMGFGALETGDELDEGTRLADRPVPCREAPEATAARAPAASTKEQGTAEDQAPARIGWTEVWHEARRRGITDRQQLAQHLGANPGGMDPAEIYRLLTEEPAKPAAYTG